MALTEEVLKQNADLAVLTPEQIAAITTLSTNDENTVIGKRIGELHGQYDTDVIAVTGLQKNQGEKSYDFVKRVLGEFKTKADSAETIKGQLGTLTTEIEGYKAQIAAGKGNEVIAQQLKDAQKKASDVQLLYDTEKANWETEKSTYSTEINNVKLETEFGKATSALKFKAVYPETVQKTLMDAARNTILSTTKQDWIDGADNKKVLVFRDKEGNILNNPENKLNPFTATELMTKQLKDVLDFGRKQPGTGTGEPTGHEIVEISDITSAKTQVEADDVIQKYLLTKGMLRGTAEFADEQAKIRKENGVAKLPVR